VYTDLDGTLLGAGGSLFRDGAGGFSLLPARALEACHHAGVEVVIKSGRRKAQVMEDARLMGQTAFVYEVGAGLVIDGEETLLCGDFSPEGDSTPHELIAASGAPELLLGAFDLEHHHPWHLNRYVSHLFMGRADVEAAAALLSQEGIEGLRLVDNGSLGDGHTYHLIPSAASKAAAVQRHMRARGFAPEECIAVGDSVEDLGVAAVVGRFFLVANATAGLEASRPNVTRTEGAYGDGFYEAVVQSLVGV